MQQTISQAAKLYGKARSTIHRAIDAGRLSCGVRGDGVRVIDLAELIRVWGEPPNRPPETQHNATPENDDAQQALVRELRALREEVSSLRDEVRQLRRLPAPTAPKTPPEPPKQRAQAPQSSEQGDDAPSDLSAVLARFEARTGKR